MFVSLLSGISFTVGVLLILLLKDSYIENQANEETWVDYPEGIVIASHQNEPNSPRLTKTGEIRNSSPYDLQSVWVDVNVFAGSALVN